jgi:DNA replication and repair protein RecF
LLDDVMSELDAGRRERLATLLRRDGQAVITTTELAHVPGAGEPDVERISIEGGRALQGHDSAGGLASLGGVAPGAPPPAGQRDEAA